MRFQLWDTESRNILYDFSREVEALEAARELIELNDGVYPGALALTQVEPDGTMTTLAMGEALRDRVQRAVSDRVQRSA